LVLSIQKRLVYITESVHCTVGQYSSSGWEYTGGGLIEHDIIVTISFVYSYRALSGHIPPTSRSNGPMPATSISSEFPTGWSVFPSFAFTFYSKMAAINQ